MPHTDSHFVDLKHFCWKCELIWAYSYKSIVSVKYINVGKQKMSVVVQCAFNCSDTEHVFIYFLKPIKQNIYTGKFEFSLFAF